MKLRNKDLARYEHIALMIAQDIIQGFYSEGQRIAGRSILAGKYGVSPETIRKSLSLLQAKDVVNIVPGSGVRILSREAAKDFLRDIRENNSIAALEHQLEQLIKQRDKINTDIEKTIKEIVDFKTELIQNMHNMENIIISRESLLLGKTLRDARIRSVTGGTIAAVKKDDRWIISPGADLRLESGDMLLAIGNREAINRLWALADSNNVKEE